MDVLVPQITEDGLPIAPQEREQNRTREQIVDVLVPQITEDGLYFVPHESVQNCTQEQIVDVLVPQITEDGLHLVPQERVQNRTPDQIVGVAVPQIMEDSLSFVPQERVQNHTQEHIADFPVPQNMEDYAGIIRAFPQERVQYRFPEPIVDVCAVSTGKVFTVKLRHHCDDQAFLDFVGFIKGLDKHNLPRVGDVMVPPPQIPKNSFFMKSPVAAKVNEPLYRFYQRYSGRSSRSKLHR